jgi:TRAP-type C4-dicarboxylate transport system substrate-binding protein
MDWTNPVSRRDFARLALAGAGATGVGAMGMPGLLAAAESELKMACFAGRGHPIWAGMMLPWARRVEAADVGLTIKGFPGGAIGGRPAEAYRRILTGVSDIELHVPGFTSTVFPRTLVAEVPLQWKSPTEATIALDRILATHLADDYEGLKVLALWTADLPVVMTVKAVRTPEDLEGLRLRVSSRTQADVIAGLGATPVAVPMTQAHIALKKGIVDGAVVGLSVASRFKLHEVVKNFIIDLPFGYPPFFIAMNRETYESLTKAQRAVIDRNSGLDYSLVGAKSFEAGRARAIATMRGASGVRITELSEAERKIWVGELKMIAEAWIDHQDRPGLDFRTLYEAYLGKAA